ncbi:TRAP transporter small permease [Anaerobacillus isosaccharinicus]|uniref:TRAP transporter small permease n=1 Tax=Anaerobacillus isosaccharinicus TaxID=1532552 RepID=A0A7S7L530_9BACI|nr:TRAP transporter small permease [Anaerobacillus isosaccharinicus]MBA5587197.1 TRAP transporter small permease [Anaerobacillus isosaccharinicus]QOY34607.1 TRAP transporter small permease [Anaerobacillus isosaccharinicus]
MSNANSVEILKKSIVNEGKAPIVGKVPNIHVKKTLFDQFVVKLSQTFACISGSSLVAMMLLIVFNAIKRTVSTPFVGTTEIVGWLAAITFSFGLAYTQLHRGHVDIDLLVKKLPQRFEKALKILFLSISISFFTMVVWQLIQFGLTLMNNNNLSQTLRIIFYPFVFITSIGFMAFVFVLVNQFIAEFRRRV